MQKFSPLRGKIVFRANQVSQSKMAVGEGKGSDRPPRGTEGLFVFVRLLGAADGSCRERKDGSTSQRGKTDSLGQNLDLTGFTLTRTRAQPSSRYEDAC